MKWRCAACGAQQSSKKCKCEVCGKNLQEEYHPLDLIRSSYNLHGKSLIPNSEINENLFEINRNPASETAFACLVYSLVPYVGILFIPFALVAGGYAVINYSLNPQIGGKKLSLLSLLLSFCVLLIQIFLWYLLYLIPEISKL